MNIFWWVLIALALVIIGAVVVVKWVFNKGHQGYTRARDGIRNRRSKDSG